MRRLSFRQIEHYFVDVTPAPALRRIIPLDDGVLGRVEMFRGMLVRGIVTASDMAAGPADPQMQPRTADLQALFASECAGRYVANAGDMGAGFCH